MISDNFIFLHVQLLFNNNFEAKNHKASVNLNLFIFSVKGVGFSTTEHAIKSLFSCFKNRSDIKFDCFKSHEITSMSRMAHFDLFCEISDISSDKLCYHACFCEAHRRNNRIKNGGSGSGRNLRQD